MQIQHVRLQGFRAHEATTVALAPRINLLHGPNGAGKTNILEAIHYLCLTKSFLGAQDSYVLRKGAPFFEVEAAFHSERRAALHARIAYVPGEGKRLFLNRAPLERLADIVGVLPVVVFAPGDQALTADGPEERRRFLDNILSQARPVYLADLMKYRRTLKQRNELLQHYRRSRNPIPQPLLDSWNAELVALGTRIIAARQQFLHTFVGFLEAAYTRIEAVAERPTLTYQTLAPLPPEADESTIAAAFQERLAEVAPREKEQGRTLIGPHRDELVFRLNDLEVRRYASQGQHRTFGMALKLAQYFYLEDRLDERPLLLLDDIFDNLDPKRTAGFLELLMSEAIGQTIITAAHTALFEDVVPFEHPDHQVIRIEQGAVVAELAP